MSSPFRPTSSQAAPSPTALSAPLQDRGLQDIFLAAVVAASSFAACIAAAFITAIVFISG